MVKVIFGDLSEGLQLTRLWWALAIQDVRSRYRRSTLGPFWLTISMAVMIAGMGPLYGTLFGQDLGQFIPHLAVGWVFWAFISGQLNDYVDAFNGSANYLRNMRLPMTLFVWRILARHFLIFAHNAIILLFVAVFFGVVPGWNVLMVIPGFVLVASLCFFFGIIIAIFCTRYRDMIAVVNNLVQVMFFLTPIVWQAEQLAGNRQFFVHLNPIYYMLEVLRGPLLGKHVGAEIYLALGVMLLVAGPMALALLGRYRSRVAYWL